MGYIFVGRLDELKGIKILLQAWDLLKDNAPELVICGTGPLESWCRNYIAKNRLNTVKMLGFVPNSEVKELIADSKALILPTQWYEGFPMAIVEAFSVGTPVIGSNIGNVGNLLVEGVNGWKFQSESPANLAETVKMVEHQQLKVNRSFVNDYLASNNYQMLSRIYKEVLHGQ